MGDPGLIGPGGPPSPKGENGQKGVYCSSSMHAVANVPTTFEGNKHPAIYT